MDRGASSARRRGQWSGALAAVLVAAASVPGAVFAHAPARRSASRHPAHAPTVTVAVGATSGDGRARELLASALSDAAAQHPSLRLQPEGTAGAALVINVHVRALTVQHDPAGALARCDVGVVVADGGGAVRAMLDARRVVRASAGTSDDALARLALRSAMDGAVRDVVSRLLPL
jgi:hypothetical protein